MTRAAARADAEWIEWFAHWDDEMLARKAKSLCPVCDCGDPCECDCFAISRAGWELERRRTDAMEKR